jgi:hypothetical protein
MLLVVMATGEAERAAGIGRLYGKVREVALGV